MLTTAIWAFCFVPIGYRLRAYGLTGYRATGCFAIAQSSSPSGASPSRHPHNILHIRTHASIPITHRHPYARKDVSRRALWQLLFPSSTFPTLGNHFDHFADRRLVHVARTTACDSPYPG
ncbi:hypothetical protein GGR50DRAFT_120990 [Xylaria sp. CBS 124048]|nr:hypothetical protein GGR50DRAFT_120990 [Xylaria sp. CBS 124048]